MPGRRSPALPALLLLGGLATVLAGGVTGCRRNLFQPEPAQGKASPAGVSGKPEPTAPDRLFDLAFVRYKQGNLAETEALLRQQIGLTPCHAGARRTLINLMEQEHRPQDTLAVAKEWVAACPAEPVESHRAYQNAAVAAGRRDALLKEYQARLTAHPESGANHYLYGRLLKDKDQAFAEYDEAVRRDPKLAPAFAAKGYWLLGRERYAEALEALQRAIDLPGHEGQVDVLYARAAVGAGAVERAEVRLRRETGPENAQELWRARWILALASGRFDDAQRLLDDRFPAETLSPDAWDLRVQLDRLAGRKPDLDKLLAGARLRKDLAASLAAVHLDQALAEKRFRDASAVVDKELPPVHGRPTLSHVYGAAALLLAGDRQQADERLAELSTALGPPRPGEFNLLGALTEALRSPVSEEKPATDLIRAAGDADPDLLPHVYFILGARAAAAGDAAAARDFFAKSQKTALTRDFPYLAAKALAG